MKTPDFTPAAIGAFIVLIVSNVLILLGLDIGANREAALDTLLNASAITAFLVHDAIVRHGRSKIAVAAINAANNERLTSLHAAINTTPGVIPPPTTGSTPS